MAKISQYEAHNMAVHMDSGYCPFPAGADTYRGCSHACLYCYERFAHNQHLRKAKSPTPRDYAAAFRAIHSDVYTRRFVADRRVAVNIGLLADPFPEVERELGVTARFIGLLHEIGIQWRITTKAPNRISDEIVDKTVESGSLIRVSFSTLDDEKARILEPNAPPPSVRLAAMRKMKERGVWLQVRLAPFLFFEDYDYAEIARAAHGVGVEFFRYSALWRNQMSRAFWRVALNRPGDDIDPRAAEREYFGFARLPNADYPMFDSQNAWVLMSPERVREIMMDARAKAKAAGLKFGMCCQSQAIHSVDLNDAPLCCPGRLRYDELALIPQWHKDRWAGFRPPLATSGLDSNILLPRLVLANAPYSRPLIEGGVGDEDRIASADDIASEAEVD